MLSKMSLVILSLSLVSLSAFAVEGKCLKEATLANKAILVINQEESSDENMEVSFSKDSVTGVETYKFHNIVSEGYRFTTVTANVEEVDGESKCIVSQVIY